LLPPAEGPPLPFSLGWQFNANGHLTGGAVIEIDGRLVYLLTSLGRTLYALSEGGEVLWQTRAAGPVYALAVLEDGRIAIGDDAGDVTLVDKGGRRLWRHTFDSRVTQVHPWQDGLLVGGWDEQLMFLSLEGETSWQVALDGPVAGITSLGQLVVVATANGHVLGLDLAGVKWRFEAGAAVTGLAGLEGMGFLVGTQDGRLLALDAVGKPLWQWAAPGGAAGGPVWHTADLIGDDQPEIVVGTGGPEPVLALISTQGEVLWQVAIVAAINAVAAQDLDGDGQDEILAGLSGGQVQAFDGQGRLRGAVHAGLPVWGLEAATDGSVLVRADVVAWRLGGGSGPSGGTWLPPPALLADAAKPFSPETERREGEAILVFLGDVALGRSMEAQLARYGPAYPWQGVGPMLHGADLAVANLEGVLTSHGRPLDKGYLLRAHPRWGQTLVEGSLDLVTLANNHALDFGLAGLEETLDALASLDIAAVGAGRSVQEAHRPALFTLNGVRIAVLGYAAARWNNSPDVPATDRLAWADPDLVQADVRSVRDEVDLVIVLLHAGTEYAAEPSADQVAVAHAAIDAGADLVVGHHPHVTQTVERYRQGLIVYSLGDALFDIPRPAAMRGHLLRIHATQAGLVQAELWPFWIEDAICPRLLDDGNGAPRFRVIFP
jgi:poly-gamma-glutamate capsule biosynthesis protein CapA/YwtB (metallophosphatase superfamily)